MSSEPNLTAGIKEDLEEAFKNFESKSGNQTPYEDSSSLSSSSSSFISEINRNEKCLLEKNIIRLCDSWFDDIKPSLIRNNVKIVNNSKCNLSATSSLHSHDHVSQTSQESPGNRCEFYDMLLNTAYTLNGAIKNSKSILKLNQGDGKEMGKGGSGVSPELNHATAPCVRNGSRHLLRQDNNDSISGSKNEVEKPARQKSSIKFELPKKGTPLKAFALRDELANGKVRHGSHDRQKNYISEKKVPKPSGV